MSRLSVFPVILSCMLLAATASAQETADPQDDTVHAVVQGLAATDLLNIRQEPSPLGRTQGRLPNGTLVSRRECRLVDGYEWCRIDATHPEDQTELSGWAPGRYLELLQPLDAASLEDEEQTEEAGEREARLVQEREADLPPGLEARFSGGDALPVEEVRNGANPQPDAPTEDSEPAAQDPGDPSIPVPTPRPDTGDSTEIAATEQPAPEQPETAQAEEPSEVIEAEPQPVEEAVAPAAAEPAVGAFEDELPCARYLGQPMTRCKARVERTGPDAAAITVTWPDGGTRVIEFRDGVPAGSNGRGEFRFTREATLNMIRIGASERFEILDALPFGD